MERDILNNTTPESHIGESQVEMAKSNRTILTDSQRDWIVVVNYVFLCSIVALFGTASNIINIIVFFKQGFQNNTMNISFFGLAISDLSSLITLLFFNILMNPLFINSDVPLHSMGVQYLAAGWPHTTFSRITGWVTAYITAERCLCIAIPLKVKQVITPRRTTFILFLIYVLNIATLVPTYCISYLDWKYFPDLNKTLVGLIFLVDPTEIERLTFLLHSILLLIAFAAVIVLTAILVAKLQQKSKWRQTAASGNESSLDTAATKGKKTVKMVIFLSVLLIACFVPTVSLSMVTFIEPEFSVTGELDNMWMAMWSFGFLGEAVNSSCNILIYYNMSSKYRQTFEQIFGVYKPENSSQSLNSVTGN